MNTRQNFDSSWLTESPIGIKNVNLIDSLRTIIKDRISFGLPVVNVAGNLYKIEGEQVIRYWYEDSRKIILAIELERAPQALIVRAVGKDGKGKPPYASDLYHAILIDQNKSGKVNNIRLTSDNQLSEEGLAIWERLFTQGHKISIYDANSPGYSFTNINTVDELSKYFAMGNKEFRRWQYVITETGDYAETKTLFNIRRIRELTGLI